MYAELIFRKSGAGPIYPDQARALVAKACDGVLINPALFNRDEHQKTLSAQYGDFHDGEGFGVPPSILFDGGKDFIRIYGIGKKGVTILGEAAIPLFSALYRQGFKGVDRNDGVMTISSQNEGMRFYTIRRLVTAKSGQFSRAPVSEAAGEIARVILRGLTGVARMLDEDLHEDGAPRIHEAELPYRIDVLEGEPTPVEIKNGKYAAGYKNLVVAMPTKLVGPWATGYLRSRGYGYLRGARS